MQAIGSFLRKFSSDAVNSLVLVIIFLGLAEAIAYPGLWLNKTGYDLNQLVLGLGVAYFVVSLVGHLWQLPIKHPRSMHIFSYVVIPLAAVLSLVEDLKFPNFVFYYLHLNHLALQTISIFLAAFIVFNSVYKSIFKMGKVVGSIQIDKRKSVLLLFLVPLLSISTWKLHLSSLHIGNSHSISARTLNMEALKNQTISFFIRGTTYQDTLPILLGRLPVSLAVWYAILAGLFYLNWLQAQKSKRVRLMLVALFSGGLLYTILVALSSVSMFSPGELRYSLMRYDLTYVLAMILFSVFLFIYHLQKKSRQNVKVNTVYFVTALLLINPFNLRFLVPASSEGVAKRASVEQEYQAIRARLNTDSRLHVMADDPVAVRYYIAPVKVLSPIWQSGIDFMANPEFSQATHVYIDQAQIVHDTLGAEQITNIFGDINNVQNKSLYEVIRGEGQEFYLKRLPKENE